MRVFARSRFFQFYKAEQFSLMCVAALCKMQTMKTPANQSSLRRPLRNWPAARKGEIPRHGMPRGNFYSLRDQSPTLARNDNLRLRFFVIPSANHPRAPRLALHAAWQAPRGISPDALAPLPNELRKGSLRRGWRLAEPSGSGNPDACLLRRGGRKTPGSKRRLEVPFEKKFSSISTDDNSQGP